MGKRTVDGGRSSSTYFTSENRSDGRLKAAVLWRGKPGAWTDDAPRLDSQKDLDPLSDAPEFFRSWTGAAGVGSSQVRFDDRRGVIGIRSRIFGPAPAGHALVLLIEDDPSTDGGITVIERSVSMEATPAVAPGDRLRPASGQRIRELHAAWAAELAKDPECRRFMEQGGDWL